jgi:hypothetical protein
MTLGHIVSPPSFLLLSPCLTLYVQHYHIGLKKRVGEKKGGDTHALVGERKGAVPPLPLFLEPLRGQAFSYDLEQFSTRVRVQPFFVSRTSPTAQASRNIREP